MTDKQPLSVAHVFTLEALHPEDYRSPFEASTHAGKRISAKALATLCRRRMVETELGMRPNVVGRRKSKRQLVSTVCYRLTRAGRLERDRCRTASALVDPAKPTTLARAGQPTRHTTTARSHPWRGYQQPAPTSEK